MTCIVDTPSINLSTVAGQLSADVIVDPGAGLAPNPLVVNASGIYVVGSDGWIPLPSALAFSSADGHTYIATSSADLRSFIGPGDKIRLVQSGVAAYFFVTAIAAGTITLYGGTDYVLAATPVTAPFFSKVKSPIGFSLDPAKWTDQLRDTSDRSQASPVAGTWYNLGSLQLAVPIGVWRLLYEVSVLAANGSSGQYGASIALSTTNNSAADVDLISVVLAGLQNSANDFTIHREKPLTLAAKTTYFLNAEAQGTPMTSLTFGGSSIGPTIIRAICAYL